VVASPSWYTPSPVHGVHTVAVTAATYAPAQAWRASARAENRRFGPLSALRAHTKAPYKIYLHGEPLMPLKTPGAAQTMRLGPVAGGGRGPGREAFGARGAHRARVEVEVRLGHGRVVALYHRPSASCETRYIFDTSISEARTRPSPADHARRAALAGRGRGEEPGAAGRARRARVLVEVRAARWAARAGAGRTLRRVPPRRARHAGGRLQWGAGGNVSLSAM
jgi:hypothetical protein